MAKSIDHRTVSEKSRPLTEKELEARNLKEYAEDVRRANAEHEVYLRSEASKGGWILV